MRTAAKVVVLVAIVGIVFFFVPLVSVTTSHNYIVASSTGTLYESLALNLLHCGGYYFSQSSSTFGQGQASTGYGFFCNSQTNG